MNEVIGSFHEMSRFEINQYPRHSTTCYSKSSLPPSLHVYRYNDNHVDTTLRGFTTSRANWAVIAKDGVITDSGSYLHQGSQFYKNSIDYNAFRFSRQCQQSMGKA